MTTKRFRLWSEHDKQFLNPYTWGQNFAGSIFLNRIKAFHPFTVTEYLKDGFVLEQFIGVKDKNGLDIYEGDVIVYSPTWETNLKDIKFVVKYSIKDLGFVFEAHGDTSLTIDRLEFIQVIGNIHEY